MNKIERRIKNSENKPLSVYTRDKIADVAQYWALQAADNKFLVFIINFFQRTSSDLGNNAMHVIPKENGRMEIIVSEIVEKPQLIYRIVVDLNKLVIIN